jgi:hypothetical protein
MERTVIAMDYANGNTVEQFAFVNSVVMACIREERNFFLLLRVLKKKNYFLLLLPELLQGLFTT